jgi:Protein of unknown function (DUF3341)
VEGEAVTPLYALYSDPDAVQRAVDQLRRAGATEAEIEVISSEPFEEYEFSHRDSATWIYKIALAGGVAGFTAAWFLTSITQRLWPLETGGMPIVSGIPNAIVIFEVTMLGAILATVGTLLVTASIPSPAGKMYDEEVSDGYILVGIEKPAPDARDAFRGALESVEGGRVKG